MEKLRIIHPGNFECFMEIYSEKLKEMRSKYPNEYVWRESELSTVLNKMRSAIESGTFNKDSKTFKATCKELGIKHTYAAINEFICTISKE
jgi:hypothetical protein